MKPITLTIAPEHVETIFSALSATHSDSARAAETALTDAVSQAVDVIENRLGALKSGQLRVMRCLECGAERDVKVSTQPRPAT